MSALISTEALYKKLSDPNLRILDASWHMPAEERNAHEEYEQSHIPGAVFFDIDAISDKQSPYPHMLPTAQAFAGAVSALGIGNEHEIVVYDSNGLFSAARVWWMFRVFGHKNIMVLDGGLPKWAAENKPVTAAHTEITSTAFVPHFHEELLRSFEQLNEKSAYEQILDARSPARFTGQEPEPRPGLRSGFIPHSINLHYKECLEQPYNTLKSKTQLQELFHAKKIKSEKPVVTSCGSGVTACILALALFETGNEHVAVYDGSWAEWGSKTAA